jgi:hypothetical protein
VYLQDGLIHWLRLDEHRAHETWEYAKGMIPGKRVYSELSDFRFSMLLIAKDLDVTFTAFNERNQNRPEYGAFNGVIA